MAVDATQELGYAVMQVLNTPLSAVKPPRQRGFFTPIGFYCQWPGSEQCIKYPQGKTCWPSDSGVQVPGRPLLGEIEQSIRNLS